MTPFFAVTLVSDVRIQYNRGWQKGQYSEDKCYKIRNCDRESGYEGERNPLAEQSRKWLTEALLTLMKEKDYSEITVTEIAERALLSRSNFLSGIFC